jgi:hypothetical protein
MCVDDSEKAREFERSGTLYAAKIDGLVSHWSTCAASYRRQKGEVMPRVVVDLNEVERRIESARTYEYLGPVAFHVPEMVAEIRELRAENDSLHQSMRNALTALAGAQNKGEHSQ